MKVVKYLWNIIKWVIVVVLAVLVIIIGSVFIQTKTNPNKVPSIFGYKPFVVLSGSMESEIYTGDLAIVKEIDPSTLKVGDIIAFKDEDGYVVTHRIKEIENVDGTKRFITKGDNNNTEDNGFVTLDRVEGIYVFKIDGFGNVVLTLQKPVTLGIVLGVIILGGIIWIMADNNKISKEEKEELERLRKEKENSNNN